MVATPHVKSPYKILITSALPYVNNIPHMGNIIGCVLSADVFARYHRSQGNNVLYVCGTDEHGTATETKALEEGLTPRQICDKYYAVHKQVYEWFGISFDVFGRTSADNHTQIVQDIFKELHDGGFIIEQDVEQSFCEKDQKFLADRFVEGECPHCHYANARGDQCDQCGKLLDPTELINPKCKICGSTPIQKKSKHLFLDLAKLQPQLQEWVAKQSKDGDWTRNAVTTTEAWLQRGLEPRAITRDLSWGVPVPLKGYEDKVFYVWFDAPIGYISITGQKDGTDWRDWWQDPDGVRLYQFMAKDNIPFHTILFPATQLATGKQWTMLHHIDATEYLQTEDGKFSKSRKTGLFGDDAMKTGIPADVYRYYLLINRPENADTVFSWRDLQEKLNKELLANLGNLVNRTLTFIKNYQEGKVHESVLDDISTNFWEYIIAEETQVTTELEACQEKEALRRIMMISQRGNQYFQEQQPWKTRTEDPEVCRRAMFVLANLIKDLAILIEPFMPNTSERIFAQLGVAKKTWKDLGSFSIIGTIGEPSPLFAKLEDKDITTIKENLKGKAAASEAPKPLQLKAGRIVDVYRHPDADKLYVEDVDFGGEMRKIVSGLAAHYRQEDLRGKTAIFVTNLKPAKLRGIDSNGMILAAQGTKDGAETVEVVFVDAAPGTLIDSCAPDAEQVTIDDFAKHTLEAKGGSVLMDGKPMTIAGKQVQTKTMLDGKVR
jgi:methionyl-tRNA synthetase